MATNQSPINLSCVELLHLILERIYLTLALTSSIFAATGGAVDVYTLTLTTPSPVAGGTIAFNWTAPSGHSPWDWVAVYKTGEPDSAWHSYAYIGGLGTATSGTVHVTAAGAAGRHL